MGGGGLFGFLGGGGGSADFIFMGARIFLIHGRGGLDLEIGGAPFLLQIYMNKLVLKGIEEYLEQIWGAPKLQIQTPTDPIPPFSALSTCHIARCL